MTAVKIKKEDLKSILESLRGSYRIIGPKIKNNVITFDQIDGDDIPIGYRDSQGQGYYRLNRVNENKIFSFSNGPDSFKRFLTPPSLEMFRFKRDKKSLTLTPLIPEEKPFAFLGIRACDLSAMRLYDKIFIEGIEKDNYYYTIRKNSLIIAVNCLYPGDNCFCHSIGTGPELKENFDIALTELDEYLILEAVTQSGRKFLEGLSSERLIDDDLKEKNYKLEMCKRMFKKSIRFNELPWLIYRSLEHPRWQEIAKKDLSCGNCTQVCPTCFCSSTYDMLQLSDINQRSFRISGLRIRTWDSCFSRNFARVHGGNFRPSVKARYRQWMSHKLAYMMEQFGLPGCVGCGRCITWCPVGIDITKELEALRL